MQFYWLQYVSILENKAFLADLPTKSFLLSFTGKRKFTGHLPVYRWSGKTSQITTLLVNYFLLKLQRFRFAILGRLKIDLRRYNTIRFRFPNIQYDLLFRVMNVMMAATFETSAGDIDFRAHD